ncbi:MAG: DUF72 domain-containing protein [Treponema sp.]|nr:DUF72 domain-containing protein [Treponema sp.]MCL2251883.1 DUF72 domain-containing protein [Treponema sp.]
MSEILIGTSGYDYLEWKGGFYPEKLARNKFLEYYSEHFNSLELNGTYYRMPTAEQMQKMIERSQKRLRFTVKAFQGLTHAFIQGKDHTPPGLIMNQYKLLAGEFKKAIEPLLADNLLLCALFQFPESFHYEKEERIYLDLLLKEIADIPVVIEMRNSKWQNDQVYNALKERNSGWCITDNPDLKNLMKLDYTVTSDIAYLRFHGRNAKMWYNGDTVSRYDYLYSDEELQSFVEPIQQLLKRAKIVQLFFNNHAKSQAVINAKKIEMLLKGT